MTISAFASAARGRLEPLYGADEARSLVNRLVEGLLGIPAYKISTDPDIAVADEDARALEAAMDQLADYRPLQYVLGACEFASLRFRVREGVLIPRPETEELVKLVVEEFDDNYPDAGQSAPNVLDACTGSGCIAWSLAAYLPECQIYGCDISDDALKVACKQKPRPADPQMGRMDIARPVFFQADVLKPPPAGLPKFGIMVSNPPYVCMEEKAVMSPNVLRYEPELALFVPDGDPLLYYRALSDWGLKLLEDGGHLYFEINERFAAEMKALLTIAGYRDVEVLKDINGRDRFVKCHR